MVHERQRLTLGLETCHDLSRVHPDLDDLERHTATDGPFLLGEVNHPHPAVAKSLEDPVGTHKIRGREGFA